MTEDKIKNLLQKADETAGGPTPISIDLSAVRRRANRKRIVSFAGPIAAAAVILIAVGLWSFITRTTETTRQQENFTSLQAQLQQLQARTEATLNLIQEVLENERSQQRLDELQAQLTSIPDPIEEVQQQIDKTAFIIVYQADRMYQELNLKNSAVQAYKRVIELFPKTRWAEVARQRLSEIQTCPERSRRDSKYKRDSKGDLLWKPQNVPSPC